MAKLLVVVDTQYDFMMPRGALYVPGAELLLPGMVQRLAEAGPGDEVVFTMDTHHPDTWPGSAEAQLFPPHCFARTPGWRNVLPADLAKATGANVTSVNKPVFDVWEHASSRTVMDWFARRQRWDAVEIMGVAADYCVRDCYAGFVARGLQPVVLPGLTVGIQENPFAR